MCTGISKNLRFWLSNQCISCLMSILLLAETQKWFQKLLCLISKKIKMQSHAHNKCSLCQNGFSTQNPSTPSISTEKQIFLGRLSSSDFPCPLWLTYLSDPLTSFDYWIKEVNTCIWVVTIWEPYRKCWEWNSKQGALVPNHVELTDDSKCHYRRFPNFLFVDLLFSE